jgi:hypothetical protein
VEEEEVVVEVVVVVVVVEVVVVVVVLSSAVGRRACHRLHAVHLPQLREPHEHAANDEAPGTKARRIERRYNEDAAQQVQQAADGTQEEVSAPKVTGFAVTGA